VGDGPGVQGDQDIDALQEPPHAPAGHPDLGGIAPSRTRDSYSFVAKTWNPSRFSMRVNRCSMVWIPFPAWPHSTMLTSSVNVIFGVEDIRGVPLCMD